MADGMVENEEDARKGAAMSERLKALLEKARHHEMTPEELTRQEIGFAYGNSHYENARITIELVAGIYRMVLVRRAGT